MQLDSSQDISSQEDKTSEVPQKAINIKKYAKYWTPYFNTASPADFDVRLFFNIAYNPCQ